MKFIERKQSPGFCSATLNVASDRIIASGVSRSEENGMKRFLMACIVAQALLLCARAQDPVKVDPEEYKVEFENNYVRVLRVTRRAHSKAPMHEHPAYVLVPLND